VDAPAGKIVAPNSGDVISINDYATRAVILNGMGAKKRQGESCEFRPVSGDN